MRFKKYSKTVKKRMVKRIIEYLVSENPELEGKKIVFFDALVVLRRFYVISSFSSSKIEFWDTDECATFTVSFNSHSVNLSDQPDGFIDLLYGSFKLWEK